MLAWIIFFSKPFSKHDSDNLLEQWLPTKCILNNEVNLKDLASDTKRTKTINNLNDIKAIDITFLQQNFDFSSKEDLQFIKKLTTVFLENAKKTLNSLQQAISQKNQQEIKSYAHALKSLCGNIGAIKLVDQCKLMEQIELADHNSEAANLYKKMEFEFSLVVKDLVYINKLTD